MPSIYNANRRLIAEGFCYYRMEQLLMLRIAIIILSKNLVISKRYKALVEGDA